MKLNISLSVLIFFITLLLSNSVFAWGVVGNNGEEQVKSKEPTSTEVKVSTGSSSSEADLFCSTLKSNLDNKKVPPENIMSLQLFQLLHKQRAIKTKFNFKTKKLKVTIKPYVKNCLDLDVEGIANGNRIGIYFKNKKYSRNETLSCLERCEVIKKTEGDNFSVSYPKVGEPRKCKEDDGNKDLEMSGGGIWTLSFPGFKTPKTEDVHIDVYHPAKSEAKEVFGSLNPVIDYGCGSLELLGQGGRRDMTDAQRHLENYRPCSGENCEESYDDLQEKLSDLRVVKSNPENVGDILNVLKELEKNILLAMDDKISQKFDENIKALQKTKREIKESSGDYVKLGSLSRKYLNQLRWFDDEILEKGRKRIESLKENLGSTSAGAKKEEIAGKIDGWKRLMRKLYKAKISEVAEDFADAGLTFSAEDVKRVSLKAKHYPGIGYKKQTYKTQIEKIEKGMKSYSKEMEFAQEKHSANLGNTPSVDYVKKAERILRDKEMIIKKCNQELSGCSQKKWGLVNMNSCRNVSRKNSEKTRIKCAARVEQAGRRYQKAVERSYELIDIEDKYANENYEDGEYDDELSINRIMREIESDIGSRSRANNRSGRSGRSSDYGFSRGERSRGLMFPRTDPFSYQDGRHPSGGGGRGGLDPMGAYNRGMTPSYGYQDNPFLGPNIPYGLRGGGSRGLPPPYMMPYGGMNQPGQQHPGQFGFGNNSFNGRYNNRGYN